MNAWNIELEEQQIKLEKKREKRIISNWKKLVKGLLFREKIKIKYLNF